MKLHPFRIQTRKLGLAVFSALSVLVGFSNEPVVGYWLGYNFKTYETANWAGGLRPGRFYDIVDDVRTTNGTCGATMIFDEGLKSWGTQLDVSQLVSISNVVFRGENISQFQFADWGWNAANLKLEPGGRLLVEAGTAHVPFFSKSSTLSVTGVTEPNQYVDVINDSLNGTLILCSLNTIQSSSDQLDTQFRFQGAGDIELGRNGSTPNGYNAATQGSCPVFVFAQTNGATFKFNSSSGNVFAHQFLVPAVPAAGGPALIEIATNVVQVGHPDSSNANVLFNIQRDTVLEGDGQLTIGYGQFGPVNLMIAEGTAFQIDLHRITSGFKGGSKIVATDGGGTLVFGHAVTNTMDGSLFIERFVTVETPRIGGKGAADSPFGTADYIALSYYGHLRYTGPGETSDRDFHLRWGGGCTIEQAGTGELNLTGQIVLPLDKEHMTLKLLNDTTSDATLSAPLANTPPPTESESERILSVLKSGRGTWRIEAEASYTGATTVDGGTLALGPNGSFTASSVRLSGGTLRFEGTADTPLRTLPALTLTAATASTIAVQPGVSVTLPAITRENQARLSLLLGAGAVVKFTGLASGPLPEWITTGGTVAYLADDGTVITASEPADYTLDARGGIVPDDAGAVAAITTADGPAPGLTLAADDTAVTLLRQEQSAEEAVLALSENQTLTAGALYVENGAKPLRVTATGNTAVLTGPDEKPLVLAAAAQSTLALDGPLSVPAAKLDGAGTITVAPDVSMPRLFADGAPTLAITGTRQEKLAYAFSNGDVTIKGPGRILAEEGSSIYVGTNGAGRLTFENVCLAPADGVASSDLTLRIGHGSGTLVVGAGACLTNKLVLGVGTAGALRLKGGMLVNTVPADNIIYNVFNKGAIHLDVQSGSYYGRNKMSWGDMAQIVLDQTGGLFSQSGNLVIGAWDTQVSCLVKGGTFQCFSDLELPAWSAGNNRYGYGDRLNYVISVDDDGVLDLTKVTMGRIINNSNHTNPANTHANPAIVNLNGGICKINRFARDAAYLRSVHVSSRAFVNFDGGTLQMKNNECPFGIPETVGEAFTGRIWGIDRVTVFAGGATLDTNGKSATAYMPFDVPYGLGVTAVTVPADIAERTFIAPPAVVIIGDGEGASAHPLFDRETGKVTGVTVTSPGWGYTAATARFCGNGTAVRAESVCTLGAVPGGTLTKTGTGTYTFACTNTVRAVRVAGGTLAQNVDDAFPTDTVLTLDGGTYDLGGKSQSFARVNATAAGGSLENGTVTLPGFTFDLADARAGRIPRFDVSLSFPEGAETTILNTALATQSPGRFILAYAPGLTTDKLPPLTEETAAALSASWELTVSEGRVMLLFTAGTTILFR